MEDKSIPAGTTGANFDIQTQLAEVRAQMKEVQDKYETQLVELVSTRALVKIKPDEELSFVALRDQVAGLLRYSEARSIISIEDVKLATEDLSLMSGVKKAIEEKRVEFTGPLNGYLKEINATFKQLSDPLAQADRITRDKVLAYRAEQERKRFEVEEINRQKIELARREAALNQGEITVDLTPVTVPDAVPAHIFTSTGSMGTSKMWKFEVVDFVLLPAEYKLPDLIKIGKVIKAGVSIPGVKAWQEEGLRITPARG